MYSPAPSSIAPPSSPPPQLLRLRCLHLTWLRPHRCTKNAIIRHETKRDSWKLIYSSAVCDGKAKSGSNSDVLKSIEEISYVSENYRLSRSEDDVLRVYRRVTAPRKSTAAAAAAVAVPVGAGAGAGDDTSAAMVGGGPVDEKKVAGRASATAAGRRLVKQPLRKRMFFGFLRR